jgi:hypothetical protein
MRLSSFYNNLDMDDLKKRMNINTGDLESTDILSGDCFECVKYKAYNLIDIQNYSNVLKYASSLESKLQELEPENAEERERYKILQYWVLRLKLFAFSSLSEGEKLAILKEFTKEILSIGLDIRRILYNFLNFFETDTIILGYSRVFLTALIANQELLGSDEQHFMQSNFKPFVSNWLLEYQGVVRLSGKMGLDPGAFHLVKFMDSNKHVKYLKPLEKETLRELLDLYNWLLNPFSSSGSHNFIKPSSFVQLDSVSLQKAASKFTDEPVIAPNVLIPKAVGQIKADGVKNGLPPLKNVLTQNSVDKNLSLAKSLVNKVPDETRGKIDKKLEELEKRVDFKN